MDASTDITPTQLPVDFAGRARPQTDCRGNGSHVQPCLAEALSSSMWRSEQTLQSRPHSVAGWGPDPRSRRTREHSMRDVKLGLARRDDRQGSRIGETDPISGAGVAVAVAEAESALAERSSSLPALKALLSRHKLLLAALGRSNRLLENENVRIERELAAQARDGGPASPPAVPEHDAPTLAASTDE